MNITKLPFDVLCAENESKIFFNRLKHKALRMFQIKSNSSPDFDYDFSHKKKNKI